MAGRLPALVAEREDCLVTWTLSIAGTQRDLQITNTGTRCTRGLSSNTLALPRPEVHSMSRFLLSALLVFAAACSATQLPSVQVSPEGAAFTASWLEPLRLGSEVKHWHVTIRTIRDSADRPLSEKVMTQAVIAPAEADEIVVASAWRPPLTSVDTMMIAPHGLRPVREVLAFNGFTRRYQYAGNHVWGTVQHADSAQRKVDRMFPEPVFAFSEVELLVRAVPFRSGWSIVVPLFSESDEDVEHDTITVVSPIQLRDNGRDLGAWIIRFADPAIVSTYILSAHSREILSIDTQQRRTGAVLRFRAAP